MDIPTRASDTVRDRLHILDVATYTAHRGVIVGGMGIPVDASTINPFNFGRAILSMKIVDYSIPFSWDVITGSNGVIYFTEDAGGGLTTAVITQGSPDITTFLTDLGNVMTAASPNGHTYTATVDTNTQKISIENNTGEWTLNFDTADGVAAKLIGFGFDDYASSSRVVTAPYPHQITQGEDAYLMLTSDFLIAPEEGEDPLTRTSGIAIYDENIQGALQNICEIPINKPHGSVLTPIRGFKGIEFAIGNPNENIVTLNRNFNFYLYKPARNVTATGGAQSVTFSTITTNIPWTMTFELSLA